MHLPLRQRRGIVGGGKIGDAGDLLRVEAGDRELPGVITGREWGKEPRLNAVTGFKAMVFNLLLLFALLKMLHETSCPLLCASVFGGVRIFFLLLGAPFLSTLACAGIAFGLSWGYFELLEREKHSGNFWPILIVGFIVIIFAT